MPANVLAVLSLLIVTAPTPPPRPWNPTPAMVEWADYFVPESGALRHRSRSLHQALVVRRGLVASPQFALSQTAREAYAGRQVDCVGFAFLYLGLARELGLPAYFVVRDDRATVGRVHGARVHGARVHGARVQERHLAVALWDGYDELVVDHGGLHDHDDFRFIEDDEAEALLWSNRGVRAAYEDDCAGAVTSLRRALRLTADPDIARNLAVVSSRCSG